MSEKTLEHIDADAHNRAQAISADEYYRNWQTAAANAQLYHTTLMTVRLERDALTERVAALEAALKFYADPISYMWWVAHPETKDTRKVLLDKGDIARAALSAPQ